jgi:hypothetical protein
LNAAAIFASASADIENQLHSYHSQPPVSIPTISKSVAAALLQKSIRRGRTDLARAAANTPLRGAPDRLSRRLSIIAVEDVGLGDPGALCMTIAASVHRRRLVGRFGEWRLASFIVSRLASAPKCRAGDDLHVVAQDCPAWHYDRLEIAELPFRNLLDVIAGDDPIERRAIATRYAIGTAGSSSTGALARRPGYPDAVFDLLCEITPHTLAEIARGAYQQTGELICAFLSLLHQQFGGMRAMFAQMFREENVHKVRRGMTGLIKQGLSAGGKAYGYRPDPANRGKLVIVQEEAAIVVRIFEDYAKGVSPKAICKWLNAEFVKLPRGKLWAPSALYGFASRGTGMLRNPIYVAASCGTRSTWSKTRIWASACPVRTRKRMEDGGRSRIAHRAGRAFRGCAGSNGRTRGHGQGRTYSGQQQAQAAPVRPSNAGLVVRAWPWVVLISRAERAFAVPLIPIAEPAPTRRRSI